MNARKNNCLRFSCLGLTVNNNMLISCSELDVLENERNSCYCDRENTKVGILIGILEAEVIYLVSLTVDNAAEFLKNEVIKYLRQAES